MFVVLDTGPLGMVTHPRASGQNRECSTWLQGMLRGGHSVVVPEICDYELRRELLRADKRDSLRRLDALESALLYLPLSTLVMKSAAHLWALARNEGRPTAAMEALELMSSSLRKLFRSGLAQIRRLLQRPTWGIWNGSLTHARGAKSPRPRFIPAGPARHRIADQVGGSRPTAADR